MYPRQPQRINIKKRSSAKAAAHIYNYNNKQRTRKTNISKHMLCINQQQRENFNPSYAWRAAASGERRQTYRIASLTYSYFDGGDRTA